MPLPGGSGVRRGIINNSRCHDVSHYGFMSDEGGSAINVLALTVTLFCLIRYWTAANFWTTWNVCKWTAGMSRR